MHQMIGDSHGPGLMPLAVLLSVLAVAALLVIFFRRPAASGALAPPPLAAPAIPLPPEAGDGESGTERDTYLVIPDISGYTRFISLNRFSVGHAQHIISELLGALMASVSPQLLPAKIEGDAILFFGFTDRTGGLAGADLGATILAMLGDFYAKRKALEDANLCPCNACRRIGELDLKVFVHRGRVLPYRLGGFYELSGLPVILIHRLLKNRLGRRRYILVTEPCHAACRLPDRLVPVRHVETLDDVGTVTCFVYGFEIEDLAAPQAGQSASTAKARDLARKLSANARTLGRSVGLARQTNLR